jgi:TPR repeat protein
MPAWSLAAVFLLALAAPAAAAGPVPYSLPDEPDYEEEKLQFQRGSLFYYGLPARGTSALGEARQLILQGLASEQGKGVPQDYAAARAYYQAAAERGAADAALLLGVMHYQGKGTPQDYEEARRWFERAAAAGSNAALVDLGWMSEYGQGMPQDNALAHDRYALAAHRGDPMGRYNLGMQYYLGKGVARDPRRASQWFTQAARQGFVPAQYQLGMIALDAGRAIDAYRWFRLAEKAFYPGSGYNRKKVEPHLTADEVAGAEAWVARRIGPRRP